MKKTSIFGTLVAIVAVVFAVTGCRNQGGGSQITGLTVKPAAITLSPEESTRLAAITTPEGVEAAITWASSDTNVVTVKEDGTITAVAVGTANVTATSGEYSGVCAVTVADYLSTLNFTGAFVYDYDTTYSDKLDTLRSESWGDKYYVAKKVLCNVMVFSEGFYYNSEGKLAGAEKGAILEFEAPFYWAPKWCNGGSGTIFTLGTWLISDDYTKYPDSTDMIGRPYSIDSVAYTNAINTFVQNYFVKGDDSQVGNDLKNAAAKISGAKLGIYEFHSTEEGYPSDGYFSSYIPDLVIGNGGMVLDQGYAASDYMLKVTAHSFVGKELRYDTSAEDGIYIYGARFNETEEAITLVDNIVYFGQEYAYKLNVASAAPRRGGKVAYQPIPAIELSDAQKAAFREQLNRPAILKK